MHIVHIQPEFHIYYYRTTLPISLFIGPVLNMICCAHRDKVFYIGASQHPLNAQILLMGSITSKGINTFEAFKFSDKTEKNII